MSASKKKDKRGNYERDNISRGKYIGRDNTSVVENPNATPYIALIANGYNSRKKMLKYLKSVSGWNNTYFSKFRKEKIISIDYKEFKTDYYKIEWNNLFLKFKELMDKSLSKKETELSLAFSLMSEKTSLIETKANSSKFRNKEDIKKRKKFHIMKVNYLESKSLSDGMKKHLKNLKMYRKWLKELFMNIERDGINWLICGFTDYLNQTISLRLTHNTMDLDKEKRIRYSNEFKWKSLYDEFIYFCRLKLKYQPNFERQSKAYNKFPFKRKKEVENLFRTIFRRFFYFIDMNEEELFLVRPWEEKVYLKMQKQIERKKHGME